MTLFLVFIPCTLIKYLLFARPCAQILFEAQRCYVGYLEGFCPRSTASYLVQHFLWHFLCHGCCNEPWEDRVTADPMSVEGRVAADSGRGLSTDLPPIPPTCLSKSLCTPRAV